MQGVCNSFSVDKTLKTASAASAVTVSKMGAAPSIPYMNEVKAALPLMEEYELSKENGKAKKISGYIDNNLNSAKLSELSNLLGYTKEYTSELVKKEMGTGFSVLLRTKRIERAALLLRETELSIGEIIEKTGYCNESFFRRHFKEVYGVSPLKYRKEEKI